MVNYCCVTGCGRHSRKNKLLNFYCLPKEVDRQEAWLKAASREDLLSKKPEIRMKYYRFCSRHFAPSSIKNKHLCSDAVPTLNLPGSITDDQIDDDDQTFHDNIVCNSCHDTIIGFRYKCITCPDYDLCPKCEMLEVHSEHYVIRIPKRIKFKLADDLIQQWRQFFKAKHVVPDDNSHDESSDDEPITKYVKNYDSGIDLSEEIKNKIRNEVTRMLETPMQIPKDAENKNKKKKVIKKRSASEVERISKKQKIDDDARLVPEVAFADVNELNNQPTDVKIELPEVFVPVVEDPAPPLMHMKVSDDLTELMIEMNDQKTIYKF